MRYIFLGELVGGEHVLLLIVLKVEDTDISKDIRGARRKQKKGEISEFWLFSWRNKSV